MGCCGVVGPCCGHYNRKTKEMNVVENVVLFYALERSVLMGVAVLDDGPGWVCV